MPPLKYQTPSSYIGKKPAVPAPKKPVIYNPRSVGWAGMQGGFGGNYGPAGPGGAVAAAPEAQQYATYEAPRGRLVTPDYSGILGSFTADARARFGAGQQATQAQRMSQARSAINRLGVRDVGSLLDKVQQYGLTQADLQSAQANPWSELKAIDYTKQGLWNNQVASRAARGGYRSGGTIDARERIDMEAARKEAELTQGALDELSGGLFQQQEWERNARDAMEQAIAQQQSQLAAAYQPYWVYD